MSEFKKIMGSPINNKPEWGMLENNFDKYYIENQNSENIPKKIHMTWLGSKIPDRYNRLINTWIEKNPDWEFKLWTDDDVDVFGLENIESYNTITNIGAKSDIFRYEILNRYGGLYVDTDFECLTSFNDLIYLDLFSGTGHVYEPEVFNGLIACKAGHPLMRKLIDDIKVIETSDYSQILSLTGPAYFSRILFEYIRNNPNDKIVIFPTEFFYAFPAVHRHMIREDNMTSRGFINRYITPKSHCVHLWYTSWQK